MSVPRSPEVLPELVLGVLGIGYEQREDARSADLDRGDDDQDDACHQAGLWTHLSPLSGLIPHARCSRKNAIHEGGVDAPCRGECSCSTMSSLTCSLPTSSSSMLRRSILPLLTASARIARAPIATAPTAVAPTARAPRPMAPIAARPKAICAPEENCFARVALRIFISLAPCPSSLGSCVPPGPTASRRRSRTQRRRAVPNRCPNRSVASRTTTLRPRPRLWRARRC